MMEDGQAERRGRDELGDGEVAVVVVVVLEEAEQGASGGTRGTGG